MFEPFVDGRNLDDYITEQIANRKWSKTREDGTTAVSYPADFRWAHLDAFRNWRMPRETPAAR